MTTQDNRDFYSHEATELELYLMNDYAVHKAYLVPVCKNLARHHRIGRFEYERAIKGMRHAVDAAAKQYNLEHGSMTTKWSDLFPVSVRNKVAEALVNDLLAAIREGNDWWN